MPKSWWNITGNLFWVAEIIAVVILIMSVIYTTMKQSAATFSPTVRNSIKDSLMNTIFAIMLIIAYPAIFYILAKINIMIVETCASFNFTPITLTTGGVASPGIMGSIISMLFTFVNLGLILKLNVDYLTRSIMIAILHIIAPAAIATISIGGTSRSLFSRWLKELVSAIYMQGFDAILLTILCMVLSSGYAGKWWWNQVFIFIIASLNSWFKTSIIGLSNSVRENAREGYNFTDRVTNAAQGVTTAVAMAGVAGVAGAAGAAAGLAGAGGAAAGGAGVEGAMEAGYNSTTAAAKGGGAGGPGGIGGGLENGSGSFENEVSKKTPTVNKADTGQKPVTQNNPKPVTQNDSNLVTQNNAGGSDNHIPTEKVASNEAPVNENPEVSSENLESTNAEQTSDSKQPDTTKTETKAVNIPQMNPTEAKLKNYAKKAAVSAFKMGIGSVLEMGETGGNGLGSRLKSDAMNGIIPGKGNEHKAAQDAYNKNKEEKRKEEEREKQEKTEKEKVEKEKTEKENRDRLQREKEKKERDQQTIDEQAGDGSVIEE